ncbi:lysozyme family protein [Vagococcus xieshaowenii]|uniref:CHAP domain-containing protein n=1 Tax=Vagococcus xieshaowenii TaxID=2562451 RepID=A0AAJ5JQY0_9ENTE|nr:lysozyme family protein [Vagococcus xieshaowenii]QCA29685.1 CHAP domain-containing protein [Vagococcus xieshaowenii]TFZ42960.1 CHAP domain-containing protein [Vagococcus xieshaowenii]
MKKIWSSWLKVKFILPLIPLLMGALLLLVAAGGLVGFMSDNTVDAQVGGVGNKGLSEKVIGYTSLIQQYASKYGVEEDVPYLLAIMETESRGEGDDPMQSSESAGLPPNGITGPEWSIDQGVKYYASILTLAKKYGLESDKEAICQAYNFGASYISYLGKDGKRHSIDLAEVFSKEVVAPSLGNTTGETYPYLNEISSAVGKTYLYRNGGNFFYSLLVYRYIIFGGSVGEGGNEGMVQTALSQIGNVGGQKFWSWYGYTGRVEWCATFVSWVADQNGHIKDGSVPKFAYCPTGIDWFKQKNQWLSGGQTPRVGDIIFFDWDGDGVSDHVGIVERTDDKTVYTVEGNTSDQVAKRQYGLTSSVVMGYGQPAYK